MTSWGQGSTASVDAFYRDATNALVDPVTPLVTIKDPDGNDVVTNAVPTRLSLGHYEYLYAIGSGADLGAYEVDWSGTINGVLRSAVDYFTVVPAGSITFPPAGHGGGPCTDWVALGEVVADPRAVHQDNTPLPDDLLARMRDVAQELLYALSGHRFPGVCVDTVRPTRRWYAGLPGPLTIYPSSWGRGILYTTRNPHRDDGLTPPTEITLGVYPIRQILEIRIDGEILDASKYRVDDLRWLRRIDGNGWPVSQDMNLNPLTDAGTFQVVVEYGEAPPTGGVEACKAYTIELAKGASGDECNLPERVLSMQMQGVSYAFLDPMDFLDKGRTGVYAVDVWLRAVNPTGAARTSQVYSPDRPRPVRRTAVTPDS